MPTPENTNPISTAKRPTVTLHLPDPALLRETIAAIEAEPAHLQKLLAEKERLEKEITDYIESGDPADDARLQEIAGFHIRLKMMPRLEAKLQRDQEEVNEKLFPLIEPFIEAILTEGANEESAWHDLVAAHIAPYAPTLPSPTRLEEKRRLELNLAAARAAHGPGNQVRDEEIAGRTAELESFNAEVDHARRLARSFPWHTIIPHIFATLRQLQKPDARAREAEYYNISPDDAARKKAENLRRDLDRTRKALDLHARIAKDGRFFLFPEETAAVLNQRGAQWIAAEKKAAADKREAEEHKRQEDEEAQTRWRIDQEKRAAEQATTIRGAVF